MRLLDITFDSAEENLAFDEVLLDELESRASVETLRFWESRRPFLVLGCAQVLRNEVKEEACQEGRVPILRRCSAGGAVLQGPGCLNFSLTLLRDRHPDLKTIRGSYCYILGRVAEALQKRGLPVHHKGVSDLALRGKKISGNAQKRRRIAILHHGTLVYDIDPEDMEKYLREPEDRPQYRGPRTHRGFVGRLPMAAEELRAVVCEAFEAAGAVERPQPREVRAVKKLAREKYAAASWTRRR